MRWPSLHKVQRRRRREFSLCVCVCVQKSESRLQVPSGELIKRLVLVLLTQSCNSQASCLIEQHELSVRLP